MYILREARHEDFTAICHLIKSKEELFLVYPNGKYPLDVAQLEELSRVRKELTVAADGDTIIGFANLYNLVAGTSASIGNVIVDKKYRGQGLGKKIVLYMLNQALTKYNLYEVKISVFSENTPALLLYSSCGFKPYAIEQRLDTNNNRLALLHMKLTA